MLSVIRYRLSVIRRFHIKQHNLIIKNSHIFILKTVKRHFDITGLNMCFKKTILNISNSFTIYVFKSAA